MCVGELASVSDWQRPTLTIKCTGRGSYQRTRLDKFGFPRGYLMREKSVKGFKTGDLVRAIVPTGKKAGRHMGRVAIRKSGSFNIQTLAGVVQGIGYRHCQLLQRADGYGYFFNKAACDAAQKREQVTAKATGAKRPALYLPGLKAEVSRTKG